MSTTVSYKGNTIATVNNNTKVLETSGTWLEDDITLVDVTSGGGSPVINPLSVTENGTYTVPSGVDGYSPVTVNVQSSGGGGIDINDLASNAEPSGNIVLNTATIKEYAFNRKKGITGVTAPNVTRVEQYAFEQCGMTNGGTITSSSFPSLVTIDQSAFRGIAFTSIVITNSAELLKNSASFGYTSYLQEARFPNNSGIVGQMCFYTDRKLSVVDVGFPSTINANAFNGCPIDDLVIRSTSVCSLANVNAFNGSSFASGGKGGKIYVPSSLISSYQSASNWSTIHGYGTITWTALEGSAYE